MQASQTVAADAQVLGLAGAQALARALEVRGVKLRTDIDVVGLAWNDRAACPPPGLRAPAAFRRAHPRREPDRHPRRHGRGLHPPLHLDAG